MIRVMRALIPFVSVIFASGLALAACGGGEDTPTPTSPSTATAASTDATAPLRAPTEPAASSDLIVFTMADETLQGDIYTADVDGGNLFRVTNSPEPELAPRWSPAGKQIAFVAPTPEGQLGLFVIEQDGTGLREIASAEGAFSRWQWSHDETMLAFNVLEGDLFGESEVTHYVVDVRTGEKLAAIPTPTFDFVWLPDSNEIAFVTEDPEQRNVIRVLSPITGEIRSLVLEVPGDERLLPFISLRNTDFVAWRNAYEGSKTTETWLWITDSEGRDLEKVAKLAGGGWENSDAYNSTWGWKQRFPLFSSSWFTVSPSPDGKKIVVYTIGDEPWGRLPSDELVEQLELLILDLAGGAPVTESIPYKNLVDYKDISNNLIHELNVTADGSKVVYSVVSDFDFETEGWRFFQYRIDEGERSEILAEVDPQKKAHLDCCGIGTQ